MSLSFVPPGWLLLKRKQKGRQGQRKDEMEEWGFLKTGGKGNLDLGLKNKVGAEVMAQWLRALTACPLHLSSAPSTHDGQLTTACNSSFRLSSGVCKHHKGTFMHMHKYTQKLNLKKTTQNKE